MNYQTYEPSELLRQFVQFYWTLDSPEQENPERQTIVADACMEMIFHYGDLYRQYLENEKSIIQPRCFVIGQLTRPLEIEPTGATGIFSASFKPGGLLPFLKTPLKDLANTAISLETLFGDKGKEIQAGILKAKSTPERIELIESFLMDQMTDIETIDRIVKYTVDAIVRANGQLSIAEISERLNMNRRQMERKFSAIVGLSPKQFSKIIRLQKTLNMLQKQKFKSLTDFALEGGYYDQAHFIKDFKEFTGLTPKEFYGNNLEMSAFFYGAD